MSRPKTNNRPYTRQEQEYIERVAGRVPAEIIAKQLRRSVSGLRQWACQHGVKLRVPHQVLTKYWREYANLPKKM